MTNPYSSFGQKLSSELRDERMVVVKGERYMKPVMITLAAYAEQEDDRAIHYMLKNTKTQNILFRSEHSISKVKSNAFVKDASVVTSASIYRRRMGHFSFIASISCLIAHADEVSRYALIFRCNKPILPSDVLMAKAADIYGCLLAHSLMPNAIITLHAAHRTLPTALAFCELHDRKNYLSRLLKSVRLRIDTKHDLPELRNEAHRLCSSILSATRGGSDARHTQATVGFVNVRI